MILLAIPDFTFVHSYLALFLCLMVLMEERGLLMQMYLQIKRKILLADHIVRCLSMLITTSKREDRM